MSEKQWNGYKGTTMTKRDKSVFEKAFAKMEAKGYFKIKELNKKISQNPIYIDNCKQIRELNRSR